jgi:hypothetical protein
LAFAQSKADFLLLLNPDALVTGAAALQLAQTMRLKADLGALSPTIYWNRQRTFVTPPTMAQSPWAECVRVASQANAFVSKWLARRHLEAMRRISNADTLQRVEFLSGAVLLLRREAVLDAAKRIQASGRNIRLEVDGGIKPDNIRSVANVGADTFVAGSAIFGKPDYKAVIDQMRHALA